MTLVDQIVRFGPLAAVGVMLAALLLRTWRTKGMAQERTYVFGRSDSVHDFMGAVFKSIYTFLLAFMLARSIWPSVDERVGLISALNLPVLRAAGVGVATIGVGLMITAQMQMGSLWRVGIPAANATGLLTTGLFAWSRNPVFVGMMIAFIGLFLAAPTAITASSLGCMWIALGVQIRLEEDYLRQSFGERFDIYARVTGRWFGPQCSDKSAVHPPPT